METRGGTEAQKATSKVTKTAAQEAFLASGRSIEFVARVVDLKPEYVKRLLRSGCDCYVTADRLRRVLGCPVEYFLPKPKPSKTTNPKTTSKERKRSHPKTTPSTASRSRAQSKEHSEEKHERRAERRQSLSPENLTT